MVGLYNLPHLHKMFITIHVSTSRSDALAPFQPHCFWLHLPLLKSPGNSCTVVFPRSCQPATRVAQHPRMGHCCTSGAACMSWWSFSCHATRPMRVTLADRNVCSVNTNGFGHCIKSNSLSPSSPPKSSQARRMPSSPEFRSLSNGNCQRVNCLRFSCRRKPSS